MDLKRSISEELIKKCCDRNIPFSVTLELTYHCNLLCKHCYAVDEHRKELSLEKIKDILDQLVELGTFYIGYTGGEIFTRVDLFDILRYAKKKGFFQVLLTNGTFISREIAAFLKEIKPKGAEISLLGATPETHDGITGVPGSFEKAVGAVRLLVEADIFVYTKITLMKSNVFEYSRIKSFAKSLGAHPRISSNILPRFDGSTQPQNNKITWDDRECFLDDEILNESFLSYVEEDDKTSLTCKAGKAVASINPYGDVSPCVVLPVKLGNLNEKSFREIWFNSGNALLKELRSLKEPDITQCFDCNVKSLCSRCAGAAYLEHKNLKSPSASACDDARWKAYLLLKKRGRSG